MSAQLWTPPRAASRLFRIAELAANAHKTPLFPISVEQLALETANIFRWQDPISQVVPADIKSFEGGLFANEGRKNWMLVYNETLPSEGRIRFTQAHELGHYILHRLTRDAFQCTEEDMRDWSTDEQNIEAQADMFASYLLMPLDDFRNQVPDKVDLNVLSVCAKRYGVSLTAATLKWLSYTTQKAVLVVSRDGYINWAWASDPAFKAGAFIKSKGSPVEIPVGSLAEDSSVEINREGVSVPASLWFKHAVKSLMLREMKISSQNYDQTFTLLCLPGLDDVWNPREWQRN